MFPLQTFSSRRAALHAQVNGPILLLGNGDRQRNLPMNLLPFRQDSTFLYFTGCAEPNAAALLEDGKCTLYLPEPAEDDALWHGHVTTLEEQRERYGVDAVKPLSELEATAVRLRPKTLAVADADRTRLASAWLGRPLLFGSQHGDPGLTKAVITMRRTKEAAELEAMRAAAAHTAEAHKLLMKLTRPGVSEQSLASIFTAFCNSHGFTLGYDLILTQHGEILHNHSHTGTLEEGRLLLVDGGAESKKTGYGADVTRTWPVSGRFTSQQRSAYDAVHASLQAATAICRPGTPYREVHDTASRVLAQFLLDEGLLRDISVDGAVETGAHALFFPHGVGHLLGLDVHDLENFGDLPAYPDGGSRPEPFGTRYLRLNLPLEQDWVVTVEPGFYVVPAILEDHTLRDRFRKVLVSEALEQWRGFGGIRLEDDVVITSGDPEILSAGVPKDADAVEALVGQGADLSVLLS